jgi:hypothetical protein
LRSTNPGTILSCFGQDFCRLLFAAIGNVWEFFFAPAPLFLANQFALRCKAA